MAFNAFKLRNNESAAQAEAFRQDLAVRLQCPNCPPDLPINIVENMSDGDLVCGNCGLVLGDRIIDTRSECMFPYRRKTKTHQTGRTFANEDGDDPSRVGAANNALVDGPTDLGTDISFKDKNTGISAALRKAAQNVSNRSGDRALSSAYGEIQSWADKISLNRQTVDIAKQLYRRSYEEKVCRGKSMTSVASACLFIACRQANVTRTLGEIIQVTGVEKRQLADAFKTLKAKFEGTGVSELRGDGAPPVGDLSGRQIASSAENIVLRYCSNLGISPLIGSATKFVANKVENFGLLTGRNPNTIATACIYFTTHLFNHGMSARDVALQGGMAPSTVLSAYKVLLANPKQIINEEWVTSGKADISRLPK